MEMKNNKNQQIIIGGAVIFRENRGKRQFLLVKQKENVDWEIPKVVVRRGESSVRAVIRLASEQGGMAVRVLEEAGRATGTTIVNAKSIPQKFYYYLMLQKGGSSDLIGFDEFKWLDHGDALKKLGLKKEKDMLSEAKDVLKEWEKTHNLKKQEVVMF
jgi:ADP-ribose pyrophosphatase YjhB (NUDIX family)